MLASILTHAGYRTGLYTSPHVRHFRERIRIDGVPISDEEIARYAVPLMATARDIGGTFFEVTTAMALQYFADRRVDVVVLETGLGGRLDATNVVQPLLSIITQIDMDHMEYLGTTLPAIAGEKAGIIKPETPVVVGHHGDDVRSVFVRKAERERAPIVFAEDVIDVRCDRILPDLHMSVAVTSDDELRYMMTDLAGVHQTRNIATVLASLPALRSTYHIEEHHIDQGLRRVRATTGLAARCELIQSDPVIVHDVSHNPGGLRALVETLCAADHPEQSFQVVFGAMSDKDVDGMLHALLPIAHTLHCCSPHIPRSMPVDELVTRAHAIGFSTVTSSSSVAEAYAQAITKEAPTVACGSFHVIDELRALSEQ
jgi:dihydrofolate synthase/folylpolyglutamate synthase